MNISNVLDMTNTYGISSFEQNKNNSQEKASSQSSGDTVNFSEEAMNLLAQFQASSSESNDQDLLNLSDTDLFTSNEGENSSSIQFVESSSQDSNSGDSGSAGGSGNKGSGGGSGGGGSSSESDSTEEALRSEIASVSSKLNQAKVAAETSGDKSQLNALMAELASLEAELSALSS